MTLTAGSAALAAPPAQQGGGPLTLDVRAGFDGYIQQASFTTITVTASNNGDDVSGDLSIDVAGLTGGGATYSQPIELPRGSRKEIRLYPANFNAFGSEIEVNLRSGGRSLASQKTKVTFIDQRRLLIGVWSDQPGTLASLGKISTNGGAAAVATLTADDFPPVAQGWEALDVLVVSNADTGKLSPDQQAALLAWLNHGGRLIIAPGSNFQRTLAGLGAVSPITVNATKNASLDAIGEAVGKGFPQGLPDTLIVTGKLAPDAKVMLSAGSDPLLAWRKVGYGRVDLLAADPGLEPLRSWPDIDSLWTLILASGEARPAWAYGLNTYSDTAQRAIAAVPGVTLPSVLELCGFLMAYVVLIGPVNYFILWRLKRRELAWITVPGLVILFSAMAYFTGFQLRGSQAILHRLAVIQTWPGVDEGQVQMLFGVWSPGRTSYDIEVEPGYLARPLPQDIGGALNGVSNARIENGQNVTLRGVQVDIGSIQPFVIEGFMAKAPRIDGKLTITPTQDGLRLQGTVSNYSNLTLTTVSLITPIGSVRLADLPAGGVLKVDQPLSAGQSSSAATSGIEPFPDAQSNYYYGPYTTSSLVADLTAGEDCYNNNKDLRHCNLANSILNGEMRGSGVYLAGWTDSIPLRTQVLNASSQQKDVSLIIAQMTTSVVQNGAALEEIPPGLMTWRIVDDASGSAGSYTPYSLYLNKGTPVTIHYQPLDFVPLPQLRAIVVHMNAYDTTEKPQIEVWNVKEARWVVEQIDFGDTSLPADQYADSQGGVTLRVTVTGNSYGANLNRLDVTLTGQ